MSEKSISDVWIEQNSGDIGELFEYFKLVELNRDIKVSIKELEMQLNTNYKNQVINEQMRVSGELDIENHFENLKIKYVDIESIEKLKVNFLKIWKSKFM